MAATEAQTGGGFTVVKPPEGEMMAVVKNNPDGPLDLMVASVKGWHFLYEEYAYDPSDATQLSEWDKWLMRPDRNANGVTLFIPPEKDMIEEEFALLLVGPSRALRIPKIKYGKWEKAEKGIEFKVESKDRLDSPYFFFQYTMAISAMEVKISGNLTVNIVVNVMIRLINPYKAIFLAGGFESALDAAVQGAIRAYVGPKKSDTLRKEHEEGQSGLAASILAVNTQAIDIGLPDQLDAAIGSGGGFMDKSGVCIIDVRFIKFDIVAKDKRVEDALTAREVNRLNAIAAKDKAKEIQRIGDATNKVAEGAAAAYGSGTAAAEVEQSRLYGEAIRETNADTVVVNVGGGSTPVAISPKGGRNRDRNKGPRGDNRGGKK